LKPPTTDRLARSPSLLRRQSSPAADQLVGAEKRQRADRTDTRAVYFPRVGFGRAKQPSGDMLRKTAVSRFTQPEMLATPPIVAGIATLERDYRLTVSSKVKGDAMR
jgi:hypothetical protein